MNNSVSKISSTKPPERLEDSLAYKRRAKEWDPVEWDYTEWDECLDEAKGEWKRQDHE